MFKRSLFIVSVGAVAMAMSAGVALAQQPRYEMQVDCRETSIMHHRQTNACGINVFEPPKYDEVAFDGLKIEFGGGFVQPAQSIKHSNTATGASNQLIAIGTGFNLASANFYVNAQLTKGIRMQFTSYLSSRHHTDTYVKDGYALIDELPIQLGGLTELWAKHLTLRVGHMETDYGDAHYRRSDAGMGFYNPFIGNFLLDSFTTEIGAELLFRNTNGLIAMGGISGGEIKGNVTARDKSAPSLYGKLGVDRRLNDDLRVRVTGSFYTISKSPAQTLYAGDRSGSPYYSVLENTASSTSSQAFSGTFNPAFSYKVTAFQINPFVKYKGLELFGVIEQAKGAANSTAAERTVNQQAVDVVYRFAGDKLYVGARYNKVSGDQAFGSTIQAVNATRTAFAAGFFLNSYLLTKLEYVDAKYNDYPTDNILNGGKYNGVMIHLVAGF